MVRICWASEVEIKLAGDFLHRQNLGWRMALSAQAPKNPFATSQLITYATEKDGILHYRNLFLLEKKPGGTGWL